MWSRRPTSRRSSLTERRLPLSRAVSLPGQRSLLGVPAGSWEATPNVDALELARGELREETGLTALTMLRLGHLFEAYGYSNQGFDVFFANRSTEGESDPDPEEAGSSAAGSRKKSCGVW